MVNGTLSIRARVCASSVLPVPVGPISRMFDLNLDVAAPLHHLYPLVVLVDGDGQLFLRFFLPDHVLVEEVFDLRRFRKRRARGGGFLLSVIAYDLNTDVDAPRCRCKRWGLRSAFDFILALTAEAKQRKVSSPLLITAWSPHQDGMWALLLVAALNGIANETKVAIRRMAALNLSKGITFAPQIINKWTARAQAPEWGGGGGILPASVVKRQAGFENLAGADAFVTDLSADPCEQPGALRIAAVVYVKAALPDLRPVITQYSLLHG